MRVRFVCFLFLIGALAAVIPTFPCLAAPATAPITTIDWAQGDIQDTQANCGEMVFKNLKDKHSYSLLVRGVVSGTCSFKADGLVFHLPHNHGATDQGASTIYDFTRFGSDVIVTWQPGF
jgi:hypothetical protein